MLPVVSVWCAVCGGRGGWWSRDFRETCSHCEGTGWEPNAIAAAIMAPLQEGVDRWSADA